MMTVPMTTGISLTLTAFMRYDEIPGMEKTVSEMIVPPKAVAKVRPQFVTTGMSALRMT